MIVCAILLANAAMAQEIHVVSDPNEVARLTGQLQKSLSTVSRGSTIQTCNPVVHEFAGSQDEIYGAFCSVTIGQGKFRLLMCDDRMVKKFTMTLAQTLTPALPANTVIDFVRMNCPAGG